MIIIEGDDASLLKHFINTIHVNDYLCVFIDGVECYEVGKKLYKPQPLSSDIEIDLDKVKHYSLATAPHNVEPCIGQSNNITALQLIEDYNNEKGW